MSEQSAKNFFNCLKLLKELTAIAKILNICAEKVTDHPEYVSILLPFLKEKTSDELHYAQDVTEFLSHMASSQEHKSDFRTMMILSVLKITGLFTGLHTSMFHFTTTDMNCSSILHARGAETVCLHMNDHDPTGQVLFRSSEILWNLLERGNKEVVTAQLGTLECVLSLKEAFFHLLNTGSGHSDLQLRNDLLVITTLIAESPGSHSIFYENKTAYFIYVLVKSHNPLIRNLKLSYSNEDLKMKKLLLNLLVVMSRDLAALQLYKEEHVVLALLALMKPPVASLSECQSGSRHWSAAQKEELQLQALATLATIGPLMLEEYISCEGSTCLLLLLDWCVGPDSYLGQGHSFHATGGRGGKKAQTRHCIRVLRSVTSLGEESVNQDLCDQGIINQLLGILMQIDAGPDEDDVVALEIKSDIQVILSTLCETDMHRKELFGSEGVEMAVHFLKKGSDKFYSGLGHNKLVLSTVDCVSCVVGCYTTEDYFLVKDGVFLLLNLLSFPFFILYFLCDNPNTVPYILTWRDGNGQTAPRLLLQLWREEEEELGVPRNQHGSIADPQRPIHSLFQLDEAQLSFPANVPSAAVLEMSENLRSKIYSVFCKIGFQDLPGLLGKDYVTLTIIRRYLDFKVGEVWDEISRELSLEGVRPISPDQEALSTICKIAEDTAKRIVEEQNSILEHHQKEDIREEKLTYTEVRSKGVEIAYMKEQLAVVLTFCFGVFQHFIGHVVGVESTDAQGPAGVKVTLVRTPVRAPSQDKGEPTIPNPDYFSTASSAD
uniref:Cilia and flagella associated protein 69 n=1 Tax=Haplochromis burtoni TaxID=8153 RepID=A0A3Q2VTZ8_HAPBU